jgi:hypothetical protein
MVSWGAMNRARLIAELVDECVWNFDKEAHAFSST